MAETPPPEADDGAPRRAADAAASDSSAPARRAESVPSVVDRVRKSYGMISDILSPTRLLVLLGVIVLVPLGLIGGFDAVAQEELPTVEPETLVTVAPFELTFTAARYGEELKPAAYPEDGVRYLFVAVEVTNTSDEPVSAAVLAEALEVDIAGRLTRPGAEGPVPQAPTVFRTEDALTAKVYSPGVMVPSVAIWRLDASAELPQDVTVTLNTHRWRASSLDGSMGWRDPEPAMTLTLPLSHVKEA